MAKENKPFIVGADVGTGTLLTSKLVGDSVEVSKIRDMFIYVTDDQISAAEMAESKLDYVTQLNEDGSVDYHAIIGNDALKMANLFSSKINRPMSKGMLSPDEINASPIISMMFKNIIGEDVTGGTCVFSIPSEPIDSDENSPLEFHSLMFQQIFKNIGFNKAIPLNEASAIIYSECSKENFSGIGISFGSGQVNISLNYKATKVFSFSMARSGDWIDEFAGRSTGMLPNKITCIKEKEDFDILNPMGSSKNKKENIARQAISFAYQQLIGYVVENLVEQFKQNAELLEVEDEIPIVIAGGTSLAKSFVDVFKTEFEKYEDDFPFNISEIRHAKEPMETVSVGCMVYGHWVQKKED